MNSCTYCGETAVSLDHVIPRSFLSSRKRSSSPSREPGFKVPSCTQCNSILGSRIFDNLVERKAYVHERLKVKLRKHSATVAWDDEDMEELGPALRDKIEIAMAKRTIARDRVTYSAGPPEARWLAMEERWRERMKSDPIVPRKSICAV